MLLLDLILALHNHTKSHTLIFHLFIVLKVLNGQVYSQVSLFFFISIANKFSVKNLYLKLHMLCVAHLYLST